MCIYMFPSTDMIWRLSGELQCHPVVRPQSWQRSGGLGDDEDLMMVRWW